MDRAYHDLSAVIASAGTQSNAIAIADRAFGSVQFPAAMTGASVTLEGQIGESTTWGQLLDSTGTQLAITVSANNIRRIPTEAFGCSRIRFVSASAEAAERTILVHLDS